MLVASWTLTVAYGNPAVAQLTIVPTFDSTITNDPNAATIEATINGAIQVYAQTFSDPITVTIDFKESKSGLGTEHLVLRHD